LKYLLYFDATMAALGVAMAVPMGFVCLVYGLMPDAMPGMRQSTPDLLIMTTSFVVLALLAGVATWGVWKRPGWNWWAQGVLGLALPMLSLIIYSHVQAP
jgi:hypothetical protein